MRGKAVFAVLVTLFLMTPVQAGDVSAQQQNQDEDPRQPNANNTTLYIWADGMNQFWSHFNSTDDEGMGDDSDGDGESDGEGKLYIENGKLHYVGEFKDVLHPILQTLDEAHIMEIANLEVDCQVGYTKSIKQYVFSKKNLNLGFFY